MTYMIVAVAKKLQPDTLSLIINYPLFPNRLDRLDRERLAREWPDSVTPGGPGPEWW